MGISSGNKRFITFSAICFLAVFLLGTGAAYAAEGTVTVRLLPYEINSAPHNAWWSVDGGSTHHASGATISLPAGSYTITFQTTDFTSPSPFNFNIADDQTLNYVFRYTGFEGDLTVNLTPAGAVSNGAMWSPDYGTNYYSSGQTVALANGTYPISFTNVAGYTTPDDFDSNVSWGGSTVENAAYISPSTTLTVRLLPYEVNENPLNAWWSVDGGTTKHASGTTIVLAEGNYTITFAALDYPSPPDYNFNISDGQSLSFVFRYTGFEGNLKINITPPGAVSNGAKWSPDYGTTFYNSGQSVPLATGTYPVSFKDATGYTTPAGFDAFVTTGLTNELDISYSGNTGVLTVKIESQTNGESRTATGDGARWRLTSDGIWRTSGTTLPSLTVGSYTIEFSDVNGWNKPANMNINIAANQSISRTGTYLRNEAKIRGAVLDEFGTLLGDTTVTLSSNKGTQTYVTPPGKSGTFEFSDLSLNTKYTISVYRQYYVFEKEVQTQQIAGVGGVFNIDAFVGVYTPSNLSISGRVRVDSGGPGFQGGATLVLNDNVTTTSDGLGYYKFEGLTGGTYSIKMLPIDGYDVPTAPRTVIVPRTKSKENVDWIVTNNNLKISGKITYVVGGFPAPDVTVTAMKGSEQVSTITGDDGSYVINGLGSGKWIVIPKPGLTGYRPNGRVITLYDQDSTFVDFKADPPVFKEVKVGRLTVYADAIFQQSETRITASGNVVLGKQKLVNVDGDVVIDPLARTISGDGPVYIPIIPNFGNMTLYPGEFEIDARGVNVPGVEISFNFRLFGIKVTNFGITDSGVSLDVSMSMDFLVRTIEIIAGMTIDNSGIALNSFEASISQIPLGPWELTDTTASYDADENSFGGGTTLSTPLLDIEARLAFLNGALDSIFFAINKSIPINPPVFYMTRIGGGVSNMASDEPIQIEAEADFDVGKKLGKLRMVTINGRVVIVLSGSFSVEGTVAILGVEAGSGKIAYEHNPNRHFSAEAHMGLGSFPRVEINGEIHLTFSPFNVWGSASAVIKLALRIDFGLFTVSINYDLAGAGVAFSKEELRVWVTFLGATVEGKINGDGFQITRPGWLTWVRIPFDENGDFDPNIQMDGLGRSPNVANNLNAVTVSSGLNKAHILLAWEKGETQPSLISPSGVVYDGSSNGATYDYGIDEENHFAWFSISEPESGVWGINYTNSGNIGETYANLTEYSTPPGVAISSVEELGTGLFRINLLRSNLENEEVELFFEPADREGDRIAMAGGEQIGDAMYYDWDTTTVAPGTYSLYARVYDPENHPFLFQYDKLVRVEGDSARRISGRPKARTKNDIVKIKWKRVKDDMISFYRIYYTDDLKTEGFQKFVDIEADKTRAELSSEIIKPGRRYRIAITPVYADGSEGPLSKYQTFTYKTKKENNYPQISSTPGDMVVLGKTYTYQVKSKDLDRDKVFYRFIEAPEGMEINATSGLVKWDTKGSDPGVKAVAIQATDSNGDSDVQRYNLLVSDSTQQGMLMVRPVYDSNGNRSYVVSYWNPFLNFDSKKAERLPALLRTAASPAGINIRLREAGRNWGYFSAVVGGEEMRKIREVAMEKVGPAAVGLDNLVIEMVGKHRKEKVSADMNRRR